MKTIMTAECPYSVVHEQTALDLRKHLSLHPEGQRLIESWFSRAWQQRDDVYTVFESFIFAWFSVNAWAACVTGLDNDSQFIKRLQSSQKLALQFDEMIALDAEFSEAASEFYKFWPIFKAQQLRRSGVRARQDMNRQEVIAQYFSAGIRDFEPRCWNSHQEAGELVPLDWPHTLAAIYRVRCNLFHGEKSAHSEMDRDIVNAAFRTLIVFFRGTGIL